MNSWISNKEKTNLDGNCIRLFCVLQDFYNKFRYSRYVDVIEENQHNEFKLLKSAVVGHSDEDYDLYFKKYIGKIFGNISHTYYKMITSICREIDLYAYEIYPYSIAAIVFYNPKAPNLFVELLNRYNEKRNLFIGF